MQASGSDPHPHLTLIYTFWGAIASTFGIVLTYFLTRHSERKKASDTNRHQESKEPLTALYKLFAAFTPFAIIHGRFYGPHKDPAYLKETIDNYRAATEEFHRLLNDRLYIARSIKSLNIKARWDAASSQYHKDYNEPRLKAEVDAISADIVKMAL